MTDDLKQRAEHFTAMQKAANSRHGTGEYAGLTEYAEFTKLCAMTSLVRDQQAKIEECLGIIERMVDQAVHLNAEIERLRVENAVACPHCNSKPLAAESAPEGGD